MSPFIVSLICAAVAALVLGGLWVVENVQGWQTLARAVAAAIGTFAAYLALRFFTLGALQVLAVVSGFSAVLATVGIIGVILGFVVVGVPLLSTFAQSIVWVLTSAPKLEVVPPSRSIAAQAVRHARYAWN